MKDIVARYSQCDNYGMGDRTGPYKEAIIHRPQAAFQREWTFSCKESEAAVGNLMNK